MDLSVSFFLVASGAVLITGISKSGFGGGLGVMAVPLMSLYIAPQFAVAILMPILLAMDLLIVWRYRHQWSRPVVVALLPGAAIGLGAGAFAFQWMNADLIRFCVGLLALVFVALYLRGTATAAQTQVQTQAQTGAQTGAQTRAQTRAQAGAPAQGAVTLLGALSGFASFVAHAGGPPVKGILLRQGLEKSIFVGTNTMFFFALNATKSVAYVAMGQLTPESLRVSLILAPLLFVGIGLGLVLHKTVSQALFTRVVYGFLFLAGVKLLWDGRSVLLG